MLLSAVPHAPFGVTAKDVAPVVTMLLVVASKYQECWPRAEAPPSPSVPQAVPDAQFGAFDRACLGLDKKSRNFICILFAYLFFWMPVFECAHFIF